MRKPTISVFEHEVLRIGDRGLTTGHFDALVKFNQQHGDRFFTVRHQSLRFASYVGVIQVGTLIIEVLPKTDRAGVGDETRWRNALIGMLRFCGYLKARLPTWAELQLQRKSMLDLYLESFLDETDDLVRYGLIKRYRRDEGNLSSLKGRLILGKQITQNLVHKERFYTDHDRYDWDNDFNQILKRAATITVAIASSDVVRSCAKRLTHLFEPVSDVQVTEETFDRLCYDRKTERYRRSVALAKLIILNYQPDVRAGGQNVLAILCDMNDLFEQYVFKRVRQEARRTGVEVSGQKNHPFWRSDEASRHIRPDIELRFSGHDSPVVLDTKWKVPTDPYPSDSDLKQMFVYSERLQAARTLLVYPRTDDRKDVCGSFEATFGVPARACGMMFIDLFVGDQLRSELGADILARLGASEQVAIR